MLWWISAARIKRSPGGLNLEQTRDRELVLPRESLGQIHFFTVTFAWRIEAPRVLKKVLRIVYTDLCSLSICITADLLHRIAKLLENLFCLLSRSFLLTSSQVVIICGMVQIYWITLSQSTTSVLLSLIDGETHRIVWWNAHTTLYCQP